MLTVCERSLLNNAIRDPELMLTEGGGGVSGDGSYDTAHRNVSIFETKPPLVFVRTEEITCQYVLNLQAMFFIESFFLDGFEMTFIRFDFSVPILCPFRYII